MARAQPEPGTGDPAREFEHLMREGTRLFGLVFWIFLKINILISNGPRFHAEGTGLTVDPCRPTIARGRVPEARPVRRRSGRLAWATAWS